MCAYIALQCHNDTRFYLKLITDELHRATQVGDDVSLSTTSSAGGTAAHAAEAQSLVLCAGASVNRAPSLQQGVAGAAQLELHREGLVIGQSHNRCRFRILAACKMRALRTVIAAKDATRNMDSSSSSSFSSLPTSAASFTVAASSSSSSLSAAQLRVGDRGDAPLAVRRNGTCYYGDAVQLYHAPSGGFLVESGPKCLHF